MNILFANRYFYPYLGGVEFHIMNLALQLIDMDCKVTVACLSYLSKPGDDEFRGIKIKRVTAPTDLFGIIRRGAYDICHAHMPRNTFAAIALAAAKASGIPSVFSPHCFYPGGSIPKQAAKRLCDLTLTPLMFRLADKSIYSSPSDLKDSLDRGLLKERAVLLPNSVCCKELSQIKLKDIREKYGIKRPFILHVGRFDWVKNIDFIIRGHLEFRDTHDLLMIGQDGGELETARSLIDELGMSDCIRIVVRAPFPDICSAYAQTDATVLASSYEGFPTVLLEALYFGSPVVASDVGGVPHMLCDIEGGFCYGVGDGAGYSETLRKAIDQGRLKDGMEFIRSRYSWETNAPAMLRLYKSIKQ